MEHIDILLINPPTPSPEEHSYYSRISAPMGLCYLGTVLQEAGYRVSIIDLAIAENPKNDMLSIFEKDRPTIVGITVTTQGYYASLAVAEMAKQIKSDVTVVMGGTHATYEYDAVLQNDSIDTVVLFEGEESVIQLADFYIRKEGKLSDINGIAFKNNGEIVLTTPRPLNGNLDAIPIPDRKLLELDKYARKGTIITSRGCVKKCIFCVAGNYEGNYRFRSPENVIEEINTMYHDFHIRDFYFFDNVFTANFERVERICNLIERSELKLKFYCVARLDTVCDDLMKPLESAGCYRVEIGIESASQEIINSLNKDISVDQIMKAADLCLSYNIHPMFTFQLGHPFDTVESMTLTIDLIRKLRVRGAGAYLSVMTPYPGTPVYRNRGKYGLKIKARNWEDYRMTNPICETKNFGINTVRKILYQEYKRMIEKNNP